MNRILARAGAGALVSVLALSFWPLSAHADTVIFTETCASNPTQPLNTSATITVGTSWSSLITLAGAAATTINSGTANCSAVADSTDDGLAHTMTPAPSTDEYYVDFSWIDGGAVPVTSNLGMLVNYIDTSNYYTCLVKDDATPDAYIYKVSSGVGSALASNVNRTVTSTDVLECRIDYTGTDPVITLTNVTTTTVLATATDSSSPLTKTRKAGVFCGATPAATTDDCESALDFDTVRLSEVPLLAPTVTTGSATAFTDAATLNGNVTATGGASPTRRGFAYGTNSTLATVIATTTENGTFSTGPFSQRVGGLSANTTYYFRAYATNSVGTSTGSIQNFTTGAVNTSLSCKMKLSQGFKIKLFSGRIILR